MRDRRERLIYIQTYVQLAEEAREASRGIIQNYTLNRWVPRSRAMMVHPYATCLYHNHTGVLFIYKYLFFSNLSKRDHSVQKPGESPPLFLPLRQIIQVFLYNTLLSLSIKLHNYTLTSQIIVYHLSFKQL